MAESRDVAHIEWIVIPAPNLGAAETFYREVFGFSMSPYSETYLVFKAGNLSGALDQDLVPSSNSLSFSLTVCGIDETLGRIVKQGGDIVRTKYELGPGGGTCAAFKDPNGNLLELYQVPC